MKTNRAAFSLLELMAALSLLALLMTLLFSLNNKIGQQWQQQKRQQKSLAQTALLFEKMTRDLHSAALLPNSFFIDLPISDASCRKNLFFLTTSSCSKTLGDLCAVGYFFVAEKKAPERYECYRFIANSQKTTESLQAQNLYMLFNQASPSNLNSCERLASGIFTWKIKPAWIIEGKIVVTPPRTSETSFLVPSLVEISITTEAGSSSKSSHEPLKTKTFSTVVAFPPAS